MPESGQSGGRVRCIVLAPKGAPAALSASLERRGVQAVEFRDPFRAMAAVMVAVGAGEDPVALLVVQPGRVHRSAELVRAVERFAPHVNRWRYDEDGEPKLRGFVLERAEVTIGNGVSERIGIRPRGSGGAPVLRLAGEMSAAPVEDVEGDEGHVEEDEAGSVRELLTDEELEMLLSDGPLPDEPDRSGDRGGEGGRA